MYNQHVIIYAHPNPLSFCNGILNTIIETLKKRNSKYILIDLYKDNFQPVLKAEDFIAINQNTVLSDVFKYQKIIKNNNTFTFIFPLWWVSMPAILKGFIDRVFSYNFAYNKDKNGKICALLNNKKVNIIITMGNSHSQYKKNKLGESLFNLLNVGVFGFFGMKVNKFIAFEKVTTCNKEQRKKYLSIIKKEFEVEKNFNEKKYKI